MRNTSSTFLFVVFAVILAILTPQSKAQQFGKLRGFVTDSTSGEALAFGNVFIEDIQIGASTNDRGLFLIQQIPANKDYEVTVSYVGYQTKKINVHINPKKITQVTIQLVPLSIELQTVEKVGKKIVEKNSTDLSIEKISIKKLDVMPKGVETDVLRSVQYIPGVNSTGDVSAKYYVRGGGSDQNLILLNGVTLYNPYHSLGLFSSFDPEMINTVEFLKGAFSSQYGGRLSSVMNIISKDGNKKRFSFTGSASSLTLKGLAEGPIPNGSFLITGRKSYSTDVLNKFLRAQSVPIDFYDLSFKLNYGSKSVLSNAKFSIFGFLSKDVVEYDDPTREKFDWDNKILGFEWLQVYDVPLFSRLGLSVSRFNGEVIPNESSLKPQKNSVNDVDLSFDINAVFDNKDEISAGINFKFLETKFSQENRVGAKTNLEKLAGNLSVYGKYKYLRFENFGADAGVRVNITGLSSKGSGIIEPRLNFTYRLFSNLALKAAWGIYTQEVTTLTDEDELISVFEPWIIIPDYLDPARSIQYNVGMNYDVFRGVLFSVEGFYKTTRNLPIINDQKFLTQDPDLLAGKAESYGWEFSLHYAVHPFNITTSYTISWAYKNVNNRLFYPKYDTRNQLNILLEYNLGGGWVASAIWNYKSGLPFTQMIGFYDKFYLNNIHNNGLGTGEFDPFSILGDRNLGRLPDYHRLDISLSKKLKISFTKLELSVSAINVYDRKNIYYFDRNTGEVVNMLPFFVSGTIKIIL